MQRKGGLQMGLLILVKEMKGKKKQRMPEIGNKKILQIILRIINLIKGIKDWNVSHVMSRASSRKDKSQ